MAERTVTTVETYGWDAKKSEWVKKSKTVTTVDKEDAAPKYIPVPYVVYPQQVYPATYPRITWTSATSTVGGTITTTN